MKGILKVAILWSLVGHLVAFLPSMENGNGQSDHTHASITRAAIYLATADVINHVIDLKKYNSSDVVETVNGYFSKFFCFYYRCFIFSKNMRIFWNRFSHKASCLFRLFFFPLIENKSVKRLDKWFPLF